MFACFCLGNPLMKRSPNGLLILSFQAWAPAHLQGNHASFASRTWEDKRSGRHFSALIRIDHPLSLYAPSFSEDSFYWPFCQFFLLTTQLSILVVYPVGRTNHFGKRQQ